MLKRGEAVSPTIQIAMECGFLDEKEAQQISQDLEKNYNGKDPVLDLLVEKGVLTLEEAQHVARMRQQKHPGHHLLELTKAKRKAIQMASDSENRLRIVLSKAAES